jgi:hypothetical protein
MARGCRRCGGSPRYHVRRCGTRFCWPPPVVVSVDQPTVGLLWLIGRTGTHLGRGTTRQAGRGARDLYMTAAPAACSVLAEPRLAATGDLLNVTKALLTGGEITMPALPLARRPSSCGSCPSKCPSRGARSPVLNSNYVFELGGVKRARTADLLHARGNTDVQYRQMLARDDPRGQMPHGPRPQRRSDHGQRILKLCGIT